MSPPHASPVEQHLVEAPRLGLPFAVYGFLSIVTVGLVLGGKSPDGFVPPGVLVTITTVSCGILGLISTGVMRRAGPGLASIAPIMYLTVVAATLNGGVAGTLVFPIIGTIFGLMVGFGVSFLYLPPFFFIHLAASRVGRGRHGSLVDASDRRSIWRPTLCTALLVGVGSLTRPGAATAGLLMIDVLCTLIFVGLTLADLRAQRAARSANPPLDPGLGGPRAPVYMGKVLGNPLLAPDVLRHALIFDAVALAIGIGASIVHAWQCRSSGSYDPVGDFQAILSWSQGHSLW